MVDFLIDQLTDALWTILPLALAIYAAVLLVMRRRLIHLLEPATIQLFILSFGFAGFLPLYGRGDYTWWIVVTGSVLAVIPFVALYRIRPARDPAMVSRAAAFSESMEFRILLVVSCAAITAQSMVVISNTGFALTDKLAPSLFAKTGALGYVTQAATSLLPAFLYLTWRTRWFYLPVVAVVVNMISITLLASRAAFLWPFLTIGAALFLARLDRNTATGWRGSTILTGRNAAIGIVGLAAAIGLVWLTGTLVSGTPRVFLFAFVIRFFNSFDSLFLAIQSGLLSSHIGQQYDVLIAYTQPVHKLLHLDVGQVYNNIGEFIAVNVYHLDIWKEKSLALLALPNSNMVLEFTLSYPAAVALPLIFLYACGIVSVLNHFEPRRYAGLMGFGISQYFLVNPLHYLIDGNYFVLGLYGLGLLIVSVKILAWTVAAIRTWQMKGAAPA